MPSSSSFRLVGLPYEHFAPLFDKSDAELAALHIERRFASADFGFPCRVSLQDAQPGDELLLLSFMHQPGDSPYRASGPIFVRRGSTLAELAPGELPPYVARRQISLRAYDAAHLIVDAEVCEGRDAAALIEAMLAREDVAYVHLHNAKRGCYSCMAVRA